MASRLLCIEDLHELGIPYGRVQLGRLEKKGRFPRRVKLHDGSSSRIAWVESEVKAWLDARVAARGGRDNWYDPPSEDKGAEAA